MLKSVVVLAVLMSLLQAVGPTARKTANDHARNGQRKENETYSNEKSTRPVPTSFPQTVNSHSLEDKANKEKVDYPDKPVRIIQLHTVSAARDWFDWLALIFNGCLVLVGGGGILYARRTLRAILGQLVAIQTAGKQTDEIIRHSSLQARAAFLAAKAVINTERPWLVIDIKRVEFCHLAITATNVGRTPANIMSIHGVIGCAKEGERLPDTPEYVHESSIRIHPRLLPPNATRIIHEQMSAIYMSFQDQIESGVFKLYYIGKIVYSDALPNAETDSQPSQHESRWCYQLVGCDGPAIRGLCPPTYEELT